MTAGNLFFGLCSIVCIAGALATIISRSPIRSALGLLATIAGIAGMFLLLQAQFLAAVQLIVYAGAVVVLFVFVIMLLGTEAGRRSEEPAGSRISRFVGAALMAVLAILAMVAIGTTSRATLFAAALPEHGSVEAVGTLLFSKGIFPFELTTALLIVAVIGAIAVARGRHTKKPVRVQPHETKRLFRGPIHPRDAGHPLPKEPGR